MKIQSKNKLSAELKDLWNKFDPIGVYQLHSAWPEDEYNFYIEPMLHLLKKNADTETLYIFVSNVVKEQIGLTSFPDRDIKNFINTVQLWYKSHKS